MPSSSDLHVGERVDRDARAADLAERARVVGVVAELRRQVEGDREPGLPALEQVAVARVRLLGRGEARVLADRPRPAAVHVRVRAARVRVLAGQLGAPVRVLRGVDRLHLDPGLGLASVGRRHARILRAAAHGYSGRVTVTVRLFAGLRERAGWSRREIEAATVADVWPALGARRRAERTPLRRQQDATRRATACSRTATRSR